MDIFDGVLLASGGMNSTVLAYKLYNEEKKNILCLFLDYGQHCKDTEYETLKRVIWIPYRDNIRVIKIGDIYKG